MPQSSPRPCRRCRTGLTRERHGYCSACAPIAKAAEMKAYNRRFPQHVAGDFHKTARWQRVSRSVLTRHPFCASCEASGMQTLAQVVDHIVSASRGGELYVESNLQSLCHACHNKKTARERG